MYVKKFMGATVSEALALARRELGEDALLLGVRRFGAAPRDARAEVTVAVERPRPAGRPPAAASTAGTPASMRTPGPGGELRGGTAAQHFVSGGADTRAASQQTSPDRAAPAPEEAVRGASRASAAKGREGPAGSGASAAGALAVTSPQARVLAALRPLRPPRLPEAAQPERTLPVAAASSESMQIARTLPAVAASPEPTRTARTLPAAAALPEPTLIPRPLPVMAASPEPTQAARTLQAAAESPEPSRTAHTLPVMGVSPEPKQTAVSVESVLDTVAGFAGSTADVSADATASPGRHYEEPPRSPARQTPARPIPEPSPTSARRDSSRPSAPPDNLPDGDPAFALSARAQKRGDPAARPRAGWALPQRDSKNSIGGRHAAALEGDAAPDRSSRARPRASLRRAAQGAQEAAPASVTETARSTHATRGGQWSGAASATELSGRTEGARRGQGSSAASAMEMSGSTERVRRSSWSTAPGHALETVGRTEMPRRVEMPWIAETSRNAVASRSAETSRAETAPAERSSKDQEASPGAEPVGHDQRARGEELELLPSILTARGDEPSSRSPRGDQHPVPARSPREQELELSPSTLTARGDEPSSRSPRGEEHPGPARLPREQELELSPSTLTARGDEPSSRSPRGEEPARAPGNRRVDEGGEEPVSDLRASFDLISRRIDRLVREMNPEGAFPAAPSPRVPTLEEIIARLVGTGLDARLAEGAGRAALDAARAEAESRAADAAMGIAPPAASSPIQEDTFPGLLAASLASLIVRAQPCAAARAPRIVALVGPTGAGKTTSAAKLAARESIYRGRRTVLVAADNVRIGAVEQLRECALLIGVPFETATSAADLAAALVRHEQADLILIDTAGQAPSDHRRLFELSGLLAAAPEAERVLVMPATTRARDIAEAVARFSALGALQLAFTKIDETTTYGELLGEAAASGRSLAWLGTGQGIPDDLEEDAAARLAQRVVQAAWTCEKER